MDILGSDNPGKIKRSMNDKGGLGRLDLGSYLLYVDL